MQQVDERNQQLQQELSKDSFYIYDSLRQAFSQFDQTWIVGHKGDQAVNLQSLGLMDPARPIDVAHVHSTLGVKANTLVSPPPGSATSYEGLLTYANQDLRTQVRGIVEQGQKAVVLMPFPNQEFQTILEEEGALDHFVITAPVEKSGSFMEIENKVMFTRIIGEAIGEAFPDNLVAYAFPTPSDNLESIRTSLGIEDNRAVYLQLDVSAGGDGTVRVENQEEFDQLLQEKHWKECLERGGLKATMAVEGMTPEGEKCPPYPANGSACIVPMPDGSCRVYVDPLSHKPVGLKEMSAKQGSGVGNDWGVPFSEDIQQQYVEIASMIGKHLYEKYSYTGVFGPDCVIGHHKGQNRVFVTEVNPRWQGTTPYQTMNAIMNERLPLKVMHYAVKLLDPAKLAEALPDVNEYNGASVNEKGGFYIKVGAPKERKGVTQDLNGPWVWDRNTNALTKLEADDVTPMQVYTGNLNGSRPENPFETVVWVKAPRTGETVGGELAPIGYIIGQGFTVFDSQQPRITPEGLSLYSSVQEKMFETVTREP